MRVSEHGATRSLSLPACSGIFPVEGLMWVSFFVLDLRRVWFLQVEPVQNFINAGGNIMRRLLNGEVGPANGPFRPLLLPVSSCSLFRSHPD